ncbi:hypothetical protein N7519_003053 [Penicillium mononematosum]|uniref:uncharacterized protein n=1 Tax=Penicillium mononematosum TaxID=268346 RepID=UPI00254830F9|nr:uncharacterized protein N7519_003053 [Penicillium mononematosum]KAJ6188145.1 hypothetical protein N7519_003053 [Penicillium mononematosum]
MADSRPDIRSGRVWSDQMDDLPYDRDSAGIETKPDLEAEYTSASSSSNSSPDLPSSSKAQPVAVTKEPRSGYRQCWGFLPHWKRLPMGMKWLMLVCGLLAVGAVTTWFLVPHLISKARLEKERLAKLEAAKLNTENAVHRRASMVALPGDSSETSLSIVMPSPTVTTPVYIFSDPAQTTFLTKARVAMSTDGVVSPVSPVPSMGVN